MVKIYLDCIEICTIHDHRNAFAMASGEYVIQESGLASPKISCSSHSAAVI